MSLRARITGAVAIGVAAVVLALATFAYFSVRSNLRDEVDNTLDERAQMFMQLPPEGGGGDGRPGGRGRPGPPPGAPAGSGVIPPEDRFGGASGYFQFVQADGTANAPGNSRALLPVDALTRKVAASGQGKFYRDVTVNGTHLRVLTFANPSRGNAVQIARPLTETDDVLDNMLITFVIAAVGGLLLAAALGLAISRAALAPIVRFINRTENVSGALNQSQRLEEVGPEELERLAIGFNRTLDALEQSVEAQRHLVADASHELRTPISALRSNIQIFLESDRLPADEQVALRNSIVAELDELTQLVSDVVELARSADSSEAIEPVRLDAVVRDAIERTERRAPGIEFDTELAPTTIEHSHDRVARAVQNMLDNARKYGPADATVEVRLEDGTVSVRDHGAGFKDQDLPHVFDRFYRAADARRMSGSGLGLAIVRQAAEAHGGFAEAGNAEGGGAVVRANFGPHTDVLDPS